jgi:DNA-directed RNA polymerase subunit RPC12/RpoP
MKTFTKRDEEFICLNCGKQVGKLNYTTRDHCPYCLYSIHVDINPGDRENTCKGLLKPIGIEKFKDTYKIIYKCEKCNMIHKNIMANDDDMNIIIELAQETPNY